MHLRQAALLGAMIISYSLAVLPDGAARAEECSGENCMAEQDNPVEECTGENCDQAPVGPVEECSGEGCGQPPADPVEECSGEGCTPVPNN